MERVQALRALCTPVQVAVLALAAAAALVPCAATAATETATSSWQRALRDDGAADAAAGSLLLTDAQIAAALQPDEDAPSGDLALLEEQADAAPKRWWPIALSAVIPGLGEAVTGHRRGYFFIAGDAASWWAVKHFNDKGNDKEDEYEAFALAHWSEAEWEAELLSPDSRIRDFFPDLYTPNPPSSKEDVPLYVSREEDEREWFENLGKWDVFYWGWDDVWQGGYDPGDPADPDWSTPNRKHYVDLRGESNDAFADRDKFLTLNLITRVISVLDVAYLEGFIGNRYKQPSREGAVGVGAKGLAQQLAARASDPRVSLYLSPRGLDETRLGLRVSY